MGRRGSMRGRSGILFVSVFAIGLIIFYLSWRSLISPDANPKLSRISENLRSEPQLEMGAPKGGLDSKEVVDENAEPDEVYHELNENQNTFEKNKKKLLINQDSKEKDSPDSFDKIVANEKQRERQSNKKYYKSFESVGKTVKLMSRLVHLDLKGAAPKMSYLKKVLPLMSKLGATGLLVEYEDMFPYSGSLQNISALNSYTIEEVKEFLTLAKNNSLTVIPLIQTFGHMEFILKNVFSKLRESAHTPQVIDITTNNSYILLQEMIRQVLDAHPDATHLHIGCDEVYELGLGASTLMKDFDRDSLYLKHVSKVANIVKELGLANQRKVMPIIWDDELRKIQSELIMSYKLPSLVEIMVWYYGVNVLERVNMSVWDTYSTLFKTVWVASAFKGATGSRQFYTEPWFHLQNHFSWLEVIALNSRRLRFQGIALTGWSRYDHFATLCELLPVALPSLAVCLATMSNAGLSEANHRSASNVLHCNGLIEIDLPVIDSKSHLAQVSQDCRFPGSVLYHAMQEFYGYTQIKTKSKIEGWLSDYQIAHKFSNPGQLKSLAKLLTIQFSGINKLAPVFKNTMQEIYLQDTIDEWIAENIDERKKDIDDILSKVKILIEPNVWPRRPLPSLKLNIPRSAREPQNERLPISNEKKDPKDEELPEDQVNNITVETKPLNIQNRDLNVKKEQQKSDVEEITVASLQQSEKAFESEPKLSSVSFEKNKRTDTGVNIDNIPSFLKGDEQELTRNMSKAVQPNKDELKLGSIIFEDQGYQGNARLSGFQRQKISSNEVENNVNKNLSLQMKVNGVNTSLPFRRRNYKFPERNINAKSKNSNDQQ
ncbi:hexosaminidase D [Biomphalaria glabrata]|uniref:beta-N-acetylhexosaminidase n=1 Tax=Biomphalaria glabrata TaxID=6526 RepID=A0A9U8EDV5_BIOGL|nr:hexosaminidase D-like [Biomphalaria glabrata]XP_055890030.1 hexosaminidase D-like [Biomphalaria glabrata]